jgi:hypothetical protein
MRFDPAASQHKLASTKLEMSATIKLGVVGGIGSVARRPDLRRTTNDLRVIALHRRLTPTVSARGLWRRTGPESLAQLLADAERGRHGTHHAVAKPLLGRKRARGETDHRRSAGGGGRGRWRQHTVLQVGHVERFNGHEIPGRGVDQARLPKSPLSYPGRATDIGVVLDPMIHDLTDPGPARSPISAVDAVASVVSASEDIANARLTFTTPWPHGVRVSPERCESHFDAPRRRGLIRSIT